jgi:hypothetical protein
VASSLQDSDHFFKFLNCPLHATCFVHFLLFDSITLIIFCGYTKLWVPSFCNRLPHSWFCSVLKPPDSSSQNPETAKIRRFVGRSYNTVKPSSSSLVRDVTLCVPVWRTAYQEYDIRMCYALQEAPNIRVEMFCCYKRRSLIKTSSNVLAGKYICVMHLQLDCGLLVKAVWRRVGDDSMSG